MLNNYIASIFSIYYPERMLTEKYLQMKLIYSVLFIFSLDKTHWTKLWGMDFKYIKSEHTRVK